jgi:hypothetical protein
MLKKIGNARGQRDQPAVVVFQTDRNGLHVRARNANIAVEFSQPGSYAADEIAIPNEALADFEGRKEGTVQLERSADSVTASWQEGIVPQTRTYGIIDAKRLPDVPAMPTRMEPQRDELLKALQDASATAAHDAVRYAVNNLQLRGKQGKLVATDGKQLLVQQGFRFPWDDDVLVPASAVFGCKELASSSTVSIGRAEEVVTLALGPWTLHLAINKDGRYPQTDAIVPSPKQSSTVFELDPGDADFLLRTLDSLPGAADEHHPVTIEGNGQFIVRAKGEQQPTPTEVVLARSGVQGKSVRVVTDRSFLARALQLGFGRMHVYAPDKPIVCRDDKRTFLWVPLDAKAALAGSGDAIRVSSTDGASAPTEPAAADDSAEPAAQATPTEETPVTERPCRPEHGSNGSERSGIGELLAEAEAVKELLRQAFARTHQLISSVRRYRKQAYAVQNSLRALQQLQHIDA